MQSKLSMQRSFPQWRQRRFACHSATDSPFFESWSRLFFCLAFAPQAVLAGLGCNSGPAGYLHTRFYLHICAALRACHAGPYAAQLSAGTRADQSTISLDYQSNLAEVSPPEFFFFFFLNTLKQSFLVAVDAAVDADNSTTTRGRAPRFCQNLHSAFASGF